jgi:hypothetical protein
MKPPAPDGKSQQLHELQLGAPDVCTPVCTEPRPIDLDLARIMDAWPLLPAPIRLAILALVESGQGEKR